MSKRIRLILVLLGVAFLSPFAAALITGRPNAYNRETTSFDIAAGRVRHEVVYAKVPLRVDVEDTVISRTYRDLVGPLPPPQWGCTVSTPIVGGSSPHDPIHGAIGAAGKIEEAFLTARFTREAKRKAVLEFLDLLRTDDGDVQVRDYACAVLQAAGRSRAFGDGEMDVSELPTSRKLADEGAPRLSPRAK